MKHNDIKEAISIVKITNRIKIRIIDKNRLTRFVSLKVLCFLLIDVHMRAAGISFFHKSG